VNIYRKAYKSVYTHHGGYLFDSMCESVKQQHNVNARLTDVMFEQMLAAKPNGDLM